MNEENPRRRTVTWDDPAPGAKVARTMSGVEYLEAMARGELPAPPIMRLLGMEIVSIAPGEVSFCIEPAEYHYNPIGTVHGGLACTMFDSAMSCAVHSTLPAGVGYTTLELKVNFTRALTASTGRVVCTGKTIHVGGRIATAEARLVDEQGRLYGHATTTCLIIRPGGTAGA